MEYVRILHPREYKPKLGRFNSGAFTNSSGGGLSVFEPDCAIRASESICLHIARHYEQVAGVPPLFWAFESEDLPAGGRFEVDASRGDDCHYNLLELQDNALRKFFKRQHVTLAKVRACVQSGEAPGTEVEALLEA